MSRILLSLVFISLLSACGSSSINSDIDGDGITNELDAFPRDALESVDSDGDGLGNNSDAFPDDKNETLDSDGDGVGDNADVFPNDKDETLDSDGDGVGNNSDAFPDDENETLDSDGDGAGDNADVFPFDFDNDGTPDLTDMFPQDPNETFDSDGDGVGDNADAFPNDKNQTTDANCDGFGDNTDVDAIPDSTPGAEFGLGDGVGDAYHAGVVIIGLNEGETLSANGSTSVTVHVVEESCDNFAVLSPQDIYFTSTCVELGLAEFTPAMVTANGTASTIYHDKGCGTENGAIDKVMAYLGVDDGSGNEIALATARAEINVAPAQVGAIEFIQAMPAIIALKGLSTESTPTSSLVSFKVLDVGGNPMPNRIVKFELDHEYGGAALSVESSETDYLGNVNVLLNAGFSQVSLRVKASINVHKESGELDYSISTQSDSISLNTSLGRQNNFNIIADTFNPHAWDFNGTEVNVTAFLGADDHNPVVDGTRIFFKSTGGEIPFSCYTVGGSCSVHWRSGNPIPVDGYVTITAYARGQGDYQDANSNGLFDLNELYMSYAEAWIDANGNGRYDLDGIYQADLDIDDDDVNEFNWDASIVIQEDFIDSNSNQLFDETSSSKYQGINCSVAAIVEDHCTEPTHVAASLRLQMSAGSDVYIEGPFLMSEMGEYNFEEVVACIDGRSESHNVAWRIADSKERRNHLPAGTVINYTESNLVVAEEQGFGVVLSTAPVEVLPVWEAKTENAALTAQQRKYKYLNERAHLVEVTVNQPEDVDPDLTHGLLTINVGRMDGLIYLGLSQQLSFGYTSDYCATPVLKLEL